MRNIATAVSVLLTLGPVVARAQIAGPYRALSPEYTISGCFDGTVRYDGSGLSAVPVRGRVACFGGTARFELAQVTNSDLQFLRTVGTLTAEFDPAFTGPSLQSDPFGSFFRFTYNGVSSSMGVPCPSGVCVGSTDVSSSSAPSFLVGGAGFAFQTFPSLFAGTADLTSIRDVSALMSLNYFLPNAPSGIRDGGLVTLSLNPTVVPEPATLGLVAAGLGGVAVTAARRRRAAAA